MTNKCRRETSRGKGNHPLLANTFPLAACIVLALKNGCGTFAIVLKFLMHGPAQRRV